MPSSHFVVSETPRDGQIEVIAQKSTEAPNLFVFYSQHLTPSIHGHYNLWIQTFSMEEIASFLNKADFTSIHKEMHWPICINIVLQIDSIFVNGISIYTNSMPGLQHNPYSQIFDHTFGNVEFVKHTIHNCTSPHHYHANLRHPHRYLIRLRRYSKLRSQFSPNFHICVHNFDSYIVMMNTKRNCKQYHHYHASLLVNFYILSLEMETC